MAPAAAGGDAGEGLADAAAGEAFGAERILRLTGAMEDS
jgi:hypothetical protein